MRWGCCRLAQYIPGKISVIADALSRPLTKSNEDTSIYTVTVDIPTESPEQLRTVQLEDAEIAKIIHDFESIEQNDRFVRWTDRGFIMLNGVLYHFHPDADSEEPQLVVPEKKVKKILSWWTNSWS